MKTLLLFLALLTSVSTQAAIAIYNGSARGVYSGNSQTIRATGRAFLLLDTDTLDAYEVIASTVNGIKFYTVERLNDRQIDDVNTGTAVVTYLAKATTVNGNVNSSLLKGKNAVTTIDNQPRFIPRTFSGSSYLASAGTLAEGTSTYALDLRNSRLSNAGGLSLLDVLDAAESVFKKLGYTRYNAPAQ